MSLSEICHSQGTCNFSKLGGYLQITMALIETLLFVHISTITRLIGRVNTLSAAFCLSFLKYLFYATIWPQVNPYWSLVSELASGTVYATFLTIKVEMAHEFASEVEHLIPELMKRGEIATDDEESCERLKLSLAATMQSLTAGADTGLGQGLGALVFGVIIDAYSYQALWTVIAVIAAAAMACLQAAALFERCCHLKIRLKRAPPEWGEQTTSGMELATKGNASDSRL